MQLNKTEKKMVNDNIAEYVKRRKQYAKNRC